MSNRKYEFQVTEEYHNEQLAAVPAKAILQGFRNNTSAHGISHVNIARGLFKKVFWSFFTIVSVGALLYYGETLCVKFFSWPITVSVKVEHVSEIKYPAVTLCNMNPILLSKVMKDAYLSSLLGLNMTSSDNTTSTANVTVSTGRRKRQTEGEPPKNSKGKTLKDDVQLNLQFRQYIAELTLEQKMLLGHQLDEFILECEFSGYDCDINSFYQFYNSEYGNCFVFNSGWSSASTDIEVSRRPGPLYGLSLTFNIDQDEYVGSFAPSAGVRVVIHPQDVMPFPEDDGITISPGAITYIGLRKEEIYRESSPYGNCTDVSQVDTVQLNVYEEIYPVSYTTQGCFKTCIQKHNMEDCGCGQSSYPLTGTAFGYENIPICDGTDSVQVACTDGVMTKYRNGQLQCNCATSCAESVYTTGVSSGYWPSNANKDSVLNTLVAVTDKVKRVIQDEENPDKYKENLAKITIYFEEFNLETITESPSYLPGQFVSDIGGILGLFIGFSLLTIMEFVELLMDFIVLCFSKRKSENRRTSFVRTRTLNGDTGNINLISGPPPYGYGVNNAETNGELPQKVPPPPLYMEDL